MLIKAGWALGGVGLGAGAMYWADPRSGKVRRAQLRGKLVHAIYLAGDAFQVVTLDVAHRARGLFFRLQRRLHKENVEDVRLEARVRSALGRVCSHPGAVQVSCQQGRVELKGVILEAELRPLIARVRAVPGVRELDNDLEAHAHAGNHPALQGAGNGHGFRLEPLPHSWTPTQRFVAGLGSAGLVGYGLARGGALKPVLAGMGLLLGLRSATNLELKRLTGVGSGRLGLTLQKDITVNAPVNEVFAFWQAMHNFSRFMSHVEEVRLEKEGRSFWRVRGPAGIVFEWEAIMTRLEPGKLLEWKSVEGAMVQNTGLIHFDDMGGGRTRLDIRLTYHPPVGAIGHAFAKLLGADPKKQMDDDLLRLKCLLEQGKATGHEHVNRDELVPGRGVENWVSPR